MHVLALGTAVNQKVWSGSICSILLANKSLYAVYIKLIGSVTLVFRESKYNHLIDFNGNKTIYNVSVKTT